MAGAINGAVTDSTSAALPRVTIVISSAALMGTRTTVTNGEGLYRFPALAPGEYTPRIYVERIQGSQARRDSCRPNFATIVASRSSSRVTRGLDHSHLCKSKIILGKGLSVL